MIIIRWKLATKLHQGVFERISVLRGLTVSLLFLLSIPTLQAKEYPLFDNPFLLELVDKGGDYIYNENYDSADVFIDSLATYLPNHPIVPMMRAFNTAWQDQPIRVSSAIFQEHNKQLSITLALAEKLLEEDPNDLEGKFFIMSVHGLRAEYWAREGNYFKAMGHAQKTYKLVKSTIEENISNPEFLFLSGLYNYFREAYPERHPAYRPLLWFFKSGDREKGLIQLDNAVHHAKIVKIEASMYLSYIYLRYENEPNKALKYLRDINEKYPKNRYFKAKFIESLFMEEKYKEALPHLEYLKKSTNPYYLLCANTHQAIYFEKVLKSNQQAEKYYQLALANGEECPDRGKYWRCLAYFGLGSVEEAKNNYPQAISYYQKAIDMDESPRISKEAEERIDQID